MRQAVGLLFVLLALALSSPVLAGTLTLDPAGGGDHTYVSWKAQEGIADSQGEANQALYFEAFSTQNPATATAVVRGLEGMRVGALTGLSWEHRIGGKCDAVSPRWSLFIEAGGKQLKPVRFGCAASLHSPGSAPGWIRDSNPQPVIRARILQMLGPIALRGTITGLEIDFDRKGLVFLDNVTVNSDVWTSAADNGNGPPVRDAGLLTAEDLLAVQDPFADAELTTAEDLLALGLDTSDADLP